ncbi:MauE/DoxX family redox-associated membrane protein [Sphingobacterium paucimobilis]|uniref:Methylamine utilisation protein MauE domain-containing protein n=1 Tax=Sphingobacterium paucimobilis HER1398 TaxID=1346330 RepID=U2J6A5_9SPHI|nr:MauE/DoxX family redox-associated membrane protein [Sphingobacterium paucimobilis]ERJ58183.1 hypothetical protein M472_05340 [Sphingobacterium paucimobilis HER1398]
MKTLQIQTGKTDYRGSVARVLAIALAGILLYTATKKVMDIRAFVAHIETLSFASNGISYGLTALVVFIEYSMAFLLLFFPLKRWLYWSIAGLMLLYSVYIYAILNFAITLPCSCQGAFKSLSWEQHYLVNLGVLLVAVGILLLINKPKGHDNLRNK